MCIYTLCLFFVIFGLPIVCILQVLELFLLDIQMFRSESLQRSAKILINKITCKFEWLTVNKRSSSISFGFFFFSFRKSVGESLLRDGCQISADLLLYLMTQGSAIKQEADFVNVKRLHLALKESWVQTPTLECWCLRSCTTFTTAGSTVVKYLRALRLVDLF